jgi:hypothetical protein
MRRAILWLFIASVFNLSLIAQRAWEARYYRAFLVPHNQIMTDMMKGVNGFELGRAYRIDSGGKIDKRQYHPIAGIAIHYFQLNSHLSGSAFGVQGFYEAGLKISNRTSLRARMSFGLGYLTKQFDVYTNPMNRAIGSHFNGFMQAQSYLDIKASKQWDLQLGIGMSHFSNGNWSMPNLGINLPGAVVGIKKRAADNQFVHLKNLRGKTIVWEAGLRMGRRQMSIDDPRNIAMYMAEISWNYPHSEIRGWRGGINVYFDRSYVFEKFQALPKARLDRITEIAITAGHEYRINRLGFVTDLGLYLYRPNHTKRMYYEAVGVKYYIRPNLIIMNRLKAHLTSADYFEFGLSYTFGHQQSRPGMGHCFRWLFSGFKSQYFTGTPEF